MWIYVAYRWPSEADFLAAIAALAWSEGAPPDVSLAVAGVVYVVDAPLPGWHVSAAFRDRLPPAQWAAMAIEPPEEMPVLGRSPVPAQVTNFQARAALMQTPSGTPGVSLFAVIDAALRAGKDATPEGALAWQAWEQANDFFRDGTLVNSLGAQFGLSAAQIDALFRAAESVVA